MTKENARHTPYVDVMPVNVPEEQEPKAMQSIEEYNRIVGELRYIENCTHPDV